MKAALYTRVSTKDQVEGTSLETQLQRCRAYAESRGWEIAAEYSDGGESGVKADRPELDRLMAACRDRAYDAVVVAKLDRFGRSTRHLAAALGELDDLGIAFHSAAEAFDSSTPAGRLLRAQLGAFAEFERDMILERTASGQRAKVREGGWPGGPAPFGYALEGEGRTARLVVREDEAGTLRHAADLIIEGHSPYAAARILNGLGLTPRKAKRWDHRNLRRHLRAPTLGGKWIWSREGEEPVEVEVPSLLSLERHAALLYALERASTGPRKPGGNRIYPLSNGRLMGLCGGQMHGVSRHERGTRHYRCINARPDTDGRCEDQRVSAEQIESVVWGAVTDLLSDPERLIGMAEDYLGVCGDGPDVGSDQITRIDRKLGKLREDRATRAAQWLKAGGDPADLETGLAELEAEERALLARRTLLERRREDAAAGADRLRRLRELADAALARLSSMDPAEQAAVLDVLNVRVGITGWSECPTCGGRGKLPGGRGGTPCPTCRMLRRVPSLRIEGEIVDDDVGHMSDATSRGLGPRRQRSGRDASGARCEPAA